jgi:ABC-type oligopeptide transport system ATPase subunit
VGIVLLCTGLGEYNNYEMFSGLKVQTIPLQLSLAKHPASAQFTPQYVSLKYNKKSSWDATFSLSPGGTSPPRAEIVFQWKGDFYPAQLIESVKIVLATVRQGLFQQAGITLDDFSKLYTELFTFCNKGNSASSNSKFDFDYLHQSYSESSPLSMIQSFSDVQIACAFLATVGEISADAYSRNRKIFPEIMKNVRAFLSTYFADGFDNDSINRAVSFFEKIGSRKIDGAITSYFNGENSWSFGGHKGLIMDQFSLFGHSIASGFISFFNSTTNNPFDLNTVKTTEKLKKKVKELESILKETLNIELRYPRDGDLLKNVCLVALQIANGVSQVELCKIMLQIAQRTEYPPVQEFSFYMKDIDILTSALGRVNRSFIISSLVSPWSSISIAVMLTNYFNRFSANFPDTTSRVKFLFNILNQFDSYKLSAYDHSKLLNKLIEAGLVDLNSDETIDCVKRFRSYLYDLKQEQGQQYLANFYDSTNIITHDKFTRRFEDELLSDLLDNYNKEDGGIATWYHLCNYRFRGRGNLLDLVYNSAASKVATDIGSFERVLKIYFTSGNTGNRFPNLVSIIFTATSQYRDGPFKTTNTNLCTNMKIFTDSLRTGNLTMNLISQMAKVDASSSSRLYLQTAKYKLLDSILYNNWAYYQSNYGKIFNELKALIIEGTALPLLIKSKLNSAANSKHRLFEKVQLKDFTQLIENIELLRDCSSEKTLKQLIDELKEAVGAGTDLAMPLLNDLHHVQPVPRVFQLLCIKKHRENLDLDRLKEGADTSVLKYNFVLDQVSINDEYIQTDRISVNLTLHVLKLAVEISTAWLEELSKGGSTDYIDLAKYLLNVERIAPEGYTDSWKNIAKNYVQLAKSIEEIRADNKIKLQRLLSLFSLSNDSQLPKLKEVLRMIDKVFTTTHANRLQSLLDTLSRGETISMEKNSPGDQFVVILRNENYSKNLEAIQTNLPKITDILDFLKQNLPENRDLEEAAGQHDDIRTGKYQIPGELLILILSIRMIACQCPNAAMMVTDLANRLRKREIDTIVDKQQNIKEYINFFNTPESKDKQKNNLFRILNSSKIVFSWISDTEVSLKVEITTVKKEKVAQMVPANAPAADKKEVLVVPEKEFVTLIDRASFYTDCLSESIRNGTLYKNFEDLGKMAIKTLDLLNRFAKSGEIVDIFRAILDEDKSGVLTADQINGEDLNISANSTTLHGKVFVRTFECNVKNDKSIQIEKLYECVESLLKKSNDAINHYFDADKISSRLSILPWSYYYGRQLRFILDNFYKLSQPNSGQGMVDDKKHIIASKIDGLLKYYEGSLTCDGLSKEICQVNWPSEITYQILTKLDKVFEDRFRHDSSDSSDGKFKVCTYQHGKGRTEKLIDLCASELAGTTHYSRFLFCTKYTCKEEVTSFLFRSTMDPQKRSYVLVDVHLLESKLRDKVIRDMSGLSISYREKETFLNNNIYLLVPEDHETKITVELTKRNTDSFKQINLEECKLRDSNFISKHESIVVVTSRFAGQGKTFWIQKSAGVAGEELLVLNLSGQMNPQLLTSRLNALFTKLNSSETKNSNTKKFGLRIRLDIVEGIIESFDYLNQLLFKLCYLKFIEYDMSYLMLDRISTFYIEVQNTFDSRLLDIPFISYLTQMEERLTNSSLNHHIPSILDIRSLDLIELKHFGLVQALRFMLLMSKPTQAHPISFIALLNPKDITAVEADYHFDLLHEECIHCNDRALQEQMQEEVEMNKLNWLTEYSEIASILESNYSFDGLKKKLDEFKSNLGADRIPQLLAEVMQNAANQKESHDLLRLMVEMKFHEMFGGSIECGGCTDDYLDEEVKENMINTIKTMIISETELNTQAEDCLNQLNFFHLKIILKIFSDQMEVLNESHTMSYRAVCFDEHIQAQERIDVIRTRQFFANQLLTQTRKLAVEQILAMAKAQERYVKSRRQQHKANYSDVRNQQEADTMEMDNLNAFSNIHLDQLNEFEIRKFVWLMLKNESMKIIFRTLSDVDPKVKDFYNSQIAAKYPKLKDLIEQKDFLCELIEAFCERTDQSFVQSRVNAINESINQKKRRFMFTADNYIKIRLIKLRADLGIPLILMGESGCGKTFLLEFLAETLLQEKFRCLVLHSGIKEQDFEEFVKKCIQEAKRDYKKNLWMFFDEINTTPLISNITELLTQRQAHFNTEENIRLPENIIIVCACNPFKLKRSRDSEGHKRNMLDSQLSHKVYPLPESLISFCFNFGQLSENDELAYIQRILMDAKIPELTELNTLGLSKALQLGQKFLRENDHESAASIRDIRRFVNLVSVFINFRGCSVPEALMLSFYCCYSIRRRGDSSGCIEDHKASDSFNKNIVSILESIFPKLSENKLSIRELFEREASKITDEAKRLGCWMADIAENRPLKENIFIILHCLLAKIPVFICGRPGTSKTVSILIVKMLLELPTEKKAQSQIFSKLPEAVFDQLWGSKDTTADQVKSHFDRTRNIANMYETARKSSKEPMPERLHIVYFEEMGVADTNDKDPLKSLHPLLEPTESEQNEFESLCFIGVSNTVLDTSKMSRMLYIQRFDMEQLELKATLKDYKIDDQIKSKYPELIAEVSVEDCLVAAYIEFRQFEARDSWHKEFYGPRDFYNMGKWINQNLPLLVKSLGENSFNKREVVVQYFILAIERNFSGRMMVQPCVGSNTGEERNSSYFMKRVFLKRLSKVAENLTGPTDPDLLRVLNKKQNSMYLIMCSLADTHARHLLITIEKSLFTDSFVESLKYHFKSKYEHLGKKWEEKKFVYLNDDPTEVATIFNRFLEYVNQGCIVVMRRMDKIYSCFYDLFNKKYTTVEKNGKKRNYCQVSCGSVFVNELEVNDDFKCIIIMDDSAISNSSSSEEGRSDVETKRPTALLNRFEKHILLGEDLFDPTSMAIVSSVKQTISEQIAQPARCIHNYGNGDLLVESLVLGSQVNQSLGFEKFSQDEFVQSRLNLDSKLERISTEEYLTRGNNPNSFVPVDKERLDKYIQKLVPMYNSNYLYFLCKKYAEDPERRDQLFKSYKDAHNYNGLADFIANTSTKHDIIFTLSSSHKNETEDLGTMLDRDDRTKHYKIRVCQFSHLNKLIDPQREVAAIVQNPAYDTVIFQFENKAEWYYLELYKGYIDRAQLELSIDAPKSRVILIAHNPCFSEALPPQVAFTFVSKFVPTCLDSMEPINIDNFYQSLIKTASGILEDKELAAPIIKEAVDAEMRRFRHNYDHSQEIKVLTEMILKWDIEKDVIGRVMQFTRDEKLKQEMNMQIHELIHDDLKTRSQSDYVVDLIQDLPKLIAINVGDKVRLALTAVHRYCDLFSFLRLAYEAEQNEIDYSPLVRFWKSVAKNSRIDNSSSVLSSSARITSISESIERSDTFMRHIFKKDKLGVARQNEDNEEMTHQEVYLTIDQQEKILGCIESALMIVRCKAQDKKCQNDVETRLNALRESLRLYLQQMRDYVEFSDKAKENFTPKDFKTLFSFCFRNKIDALKFASIIVEEGEEQIKDLYSLLCLLIKTNLAPITTTTSSTTFESLTSEFIHPIQVFEESLASSEEAQSKFRNQQLSQITNWIGDYQLNPKTEDDINGLITSVLAHNNEQYNKYFGAMKPHTDFLIATELMKLDDIKNDESLSKALLLVITKTLPLRHVSHEEFGMKTHCSEVLTWLMNYSKSRIERTSGFTSNINLNEEIQLTTGFLNFAGVLRIIKFAAKNISLVDDKVLETFNYQDIFEFDSKELFGCTTFWNRCKIWLT